MHLFSGAAVSLHGAFFGAGQGPILLDQVDCNGNESHILECHFEDPGTHDCFHANDASVVCPGNGLLLTYAPCTHAFNCSATLIIHASII